MVVASYNLSKKERKYMHKESTRGLVTWMEKAEIERLKKIAKSQGYDSLSEYVRYLLRYKICEYDGFKSKFPTKKLSSV